MVDKKKKLLVVDDEKDICKFVKLLLKREDFWYIAHCPE